MSYLAELREREHARKQSRTWAAAASGQSGLPQQMFPTRQSGSGQTRLGSPVPGPVFQGEVCSVKAVDVAVSTTPTVVEFTAEVGEQAWGSDLALPSSDIAPNFKDAYYDIQVELDRGLFAGTVTVEVLRGDEVVWGPEQSPYWADPMMPVTAKGRLSKVSV